MVAQPPFLLTTGTLSHTFCLSPISIRLTPTARGALSLQCSETHLVNHDITLPKAITLCGDYFSLNAVQAFARLNTVTPWTPRCRSSSLDRNLNFVKLLFRCTWWKSKKINWGITKYVWIINDRMSPAVCFPWLLSLFSFSWFQLHHSCHSFIACCDVRPK